MQSELETPRRLLVLSYRRYIDADREWVIATRRARSWFPASDATRRAIGHPGSLLRRLYERRERALQQLQIARQEMEKARLRLSSRSRVTVHLLGYAARA